MQKKVTQRSGAPMVEILLAVGIFAICSVVIVQLFLGSHYAAIYSKDQNTAILQAENLIERLKNGEKADDVLSRMGFTGAGEEYTKKYDADWNNVENDGDAQYIATVMVSERENGMRDISVKFERRGGYPFLKKSRSEILELKTAQYIQGVA